MTKGTAQDMNKPQLNLQDTFLNQVRKENVGVTIYLLGGVQLRGNVRGFDSFTILLDSPGKPTQMVYKHAVTSIVPMRPIQNLYSEAMREAGMQGQGQSASSPTATPPVPAASAHPDPTVNVTEPNPISVSAVPEAAKVEPIS
jgi:host factor-I protein